MAIHSNVVKQLVAIYSTSSVSSVIQTSIPSICSVLAIITSVIHLPISSIYLNCDNAYSFMVNKYSLLCQLLVLIITNVSMHMIN